MNQEMAQSKNKRFRFFPSSMEKEDREKALPATYPRRPTVIKFRSMKQLCERRRDLIEQRARSLCQPIIARICKKDRTPESAGVLSERWLTVQGMIDSDPMLRFMRAGEKESPDPTVSDSI